MKRTLALLFVATAAACGYGQTKMVACPPVGCGNQYAATSPQPPPPPTPLATSSQADVTSPAPAESALPPDRTPAMEALPNTPLQPLPDRPMPPPVVPPNVP